MIIRPPQAAGKLYPADADDLVSNLATLLLAFPATQDFPRALVVPHEPFEKAGFATAAAFRHLSSSTDKINQVMIIGAASDRVNGVVLPVCDQFRTPLGAVGVNQHHVNSLSLLPFVHRNEREHFSSTKIEVQLPYLQTCLIEFQILPILVGNISTPDLHLLYESLPHNAESLTILSIDIDRKTRRCQNPAEQCLFDNYVKFAKQEHLTIVDADNNELPKSLYEQTNKSYYRSFVVN